MTVPTMVLLSWLQLHGFGAPQRDAVIWNATRESGLRSDAVSKRGGHVGLFQYSGTRRLALLRYARAHGKRWTDAIVQLEFMNAELRRMAFARRFFAATSATAARALMCREYERARVC